MKKLNSNQLAKSEVEKYYTYLYATKCLKCNPKFYKTNIHPDCLIKANNLFYAIEATGYFYQQETDYSNRLYKKVNKYLKESNYLTRIYDEIGREALLNIVDAIYYKSQEELINDLILNKDVIDEINILDQVYYHSNNNLTTFIDNLNLKKKYWQMEITLKKKYLIPIKIIAIYDINVQYDVPRTIVPITSFSPNYRYNFRSLHSLICNKERKLQNIYHKSLNDNNVYYDKFILLIHPIDFSMNVSPHLIYKELYDDFTKTMYDQIVIILDKQIMVITKDDYTIYGKGDKDEYI